MNGYNITGKKYFYRYKLFTIFGLTFYIQKFFGSDDSHWFHTHSFDFGFYFCLWGKFKEEIFHKKTKIYKPFSFCMINKNTAHKISIFKKPVWVLFCHSEEKHSIRYLRK